LFAHFFQVFEDAFEDALEEPESSTQNGRPPSSSSSVGVGGSKKKFKLPMSKRLSSIRDKRNHHRAQNPPDGSGRTRPPMPLDNGPIPMDEALEECKHAIDLFLNNKFEDAKNVVEPLADRSIYHAVGYSVFMFLKAVMTFEIVGS
jgi:hypothetical protein